MKNLCFLVCTFLFQTEMLKFGVFLISLFFRFPSLSLIYRQFFIKYSGLSNVQYF